MFEIFSSYLKKFRFTTSCNHLFLYDVFTRAMLQKCICCTNQQTLVHAAIKKEKNTFD